MKPINYGEIAHLEFFSTDLNETITVEFYLIRLLSTLWYKSHLFSGNRPFGKSGWKHDIEKALIQNEYIKGKIDEYGYVEEGDSRALDEIILNIINLLKFEQ
jgi:hypothetical protein